MAINATNNSTPRELIPAGNYIARCYQMLQIGTVDENIMGETKHLHKVRIGWELPGETKVFKEEKGPQPIVISQEYTLSMNEKATLRKMLASWRGMDFTQKESEAFDITKLIGVPCMLNIIHKPSKADPTKVYEQIAGVTPMPKGVPCPPQVNPTQLLQFDNFDEKLFASLPDFIKTKIQGSDEYKKMQTPEQNHIDDGAEWKPIEDNEPIDSENLPF